LRILIKPWTLYARFQRNMPDMDESVIGLRFILRRKKGSQLTQTLS